MGKDLKGKELGKGITQRKDGRYQARFTDRFGKRRCVYGKTLKEVKNALTSEIVDDYSKSNVADPQITFGEWYEKWLRVYKEPTIKESTLRKYKLQYNNKIKSVFENMPLASINKLAVTDFFNSIGKEFRIGSVKNYRDMLYDIFERAVENDLCVKNPVKGIRLTGLKSKKIESLTTEDQRDFFVAAKGNFYYNLFVVAINTGLRSGELRALTVNDIDLNNNTINVDKTLNYFTNRPTVDSVTGFKVTRPKTFNSIRTVPMNETCRQAIEDQLAFHKSLRPAQYDTDSLGELLFTTHLNTPIYPKTYTKGINVTIKKVNEERSKKGQPLMQRFGTHCFRHTFATRCFEAGISPKTVQTYLGHASINVTMNIYTTVQDDKKFEDIKILETKMKSIINS